MYLMVTRCCVTKILSCCAPGGPGKVRLCYYKLADRGKYPQQIAEAGSWRVWMGEHFLRSRFEGFNSYILSGASLIELKVTSQLLRVISRDLPWMLLQWTFFCGRIRIA
jgi:hypothetical protein